MQSPMLISYINNSKNGYKKPDNLQSGQIQKTDLQKDVFVSRKSCKKELTKQEKIQKLADVGACATFIAVFLYEIYKNQYSTVKKLAKNIEFTPANSVDEAIKFGKKVLGIEEYIGFQNSDIDLINWLNEGMVNVSNAFEGRLRIPKRILYAEMEKDSTLAGIVSNESSSNFGRFTLNKKFFENLDSKVQGYVESCDDSFVDFVMSKSHVFKISCDEAITLFEKFKNGKTTYKEKILLYEYFQQWGEINNQVKKTPVYLIKELAQKYNINLADICDISFEQLLDESKEKQLSVLWRLHSEIVNITGENPVIDMQKPTPFNVVYHEFGHLQDIVPRVKASGKFENKNDYPPELVEWLKNKRNIQIAKSVSCYSETGPGEFIAETFAKLLEGYKLNEDVLKLYESLGGPKIPKQ